MKENFKIEKELLFKNNIKEITSISLDTDFKKEDNSVLGNFIITGDYKIHEVSINREKFKFNIPFKHELDNTINLDTINVNIDNFVYDYKKDELIVNIDYDITAEKKDILSFDDKESLDEYLKDKEIEIVDMTRNEEKVEDNKDDEKEDTEEIKKEKIELSEETKLEETKLEENKDRDKEESEENTKESEEDNRNEIMDIIENKDMDIVNVVNKEENKKIIEAKEVIDNVKASDNFVTYKIHKVTETDTLESIVMKYHTTIDDLKEYNDLNELKINDKIIIPNYE